ncbi:hypothetical protein C0J52_08819 [Blattella germanica]|nr:hypothetical protein C0J52_08819 [Blattella germanica]
MCHLLGPIPKPQAVAVSTLLLHGTMHGRPRGLRQTTGEMSRMPRRASNPLPGCARLPNERHSAEVLGAAHRDHGGVTRPNKWTDYGEMQRLLREVRRAMHRLEDALSLVEKNSLNLQQNCTSVSEEVDEIYRRLNKALKDRTEFLRGEIDRYMSTELRNLSTLKDNLELEISNIQSNCDLADKHMTDAVEWDDCELMDAKEIFLKTVEFIRNFEYENADYNRRVRFSMSTDPNQLVLHVAGYGELTINMPHQPFTGVGTGGNIAPSGSSSGLLQPPGGPGLMRSKSDHRLASQFRQQEERGGYDRGYEGGDPSGGSGRVSPLGGRKFGERYPQNRGGNDRYDQQQSRYGGRSGGGGDYGGEFESPYDNDGNRSRSKYRSRFRHHGDNADSDNDTGGNRSVRFTEGQQHKERERVLDTEDVARGPLSGITRLYDSPRVMKRLQESEQRGKKKKEEPPVPQPVQVKAPQPVPKKAQRQVSEEDEISKIKRANKAGASASTADSPTTPTTERPVAERVAALKTPSRDSSDDRDSSQPSSPTSRTPPGDLSSPTRKTSTAEVSSDAESDDGSSVGSLQQTQRKGAAKTGSGTPSRRSSGSSDATAHKKAVRSASSESSSSESSEEAPSSAVRKEDTKPKLTTRSSTDKGSPGESPAGSGASTPRNRLSSTGSDTTAKKPFQSRFLANRQAANAAPVEKPKEEEEDDEDESESSSESEETDSESESDEASKKKPEPPAVKAAIDKSDIGPLLARSAQVRGSTEQTRRNSMDSGNAGPTNYSKSRYGSSGTTDTQPSSYRSNYGAKEETSTPSSGSKYLNRRTGSVDDDSSPTSRYGTGSSGYTSRFLNKSKSSAAMSPDEDADSGGRKYSPGGSTAATDDSKYPSGRSRYAALKDRRARLARSRSSHNFGGPEDDDAEDGRSSPTSSGMPASYLASRYGPGTQTSTNELSRSRSTHALKSKDGSPDHSGGAGGAGAGTEKDGAALSSWARYLKNKYGNKAGNKEGGSAGGSSSSPSASATAARRLSLGLPLRGSVESSDDDQKNPGGSPTSPTAATAAAAGSADGRFNYPWGITTDALGFIYVCDKENHRVQVFQSDGTFVGKFGSCGSKPGQLEHPHYIAVSSTNRVIVSDSNNHRIQIFDVNGRVLTTFGSEGSEEGQFKFPSWRHFHVDIKGGSSGRPRLHLRSGLRQQPNPNLPPRRDIPSSVRMLGIRGRGVQRLGRHSSHVQRQHLSVRPGEPSHSSLLNTATPTRINVN